MNRLLNVQAFRFGNDAEALLKAIDIGFEKSVKPRNEVYKGCLKTLEMVCAALSSLAKSLHSLQGRASMGARRVLLCSAQSHGDDVSLLLLSQPRSLARHPDPVWLHHPCCSPTPDSPGTRKLHGHALHKVGPCATGRTAAELAGASRRTASSKGTSLGGLPPSPKCAFLSHKLCGTHPE